MAVLAANEVAAEQVDALKQALTKIGAPAEVVGIHLGTLTGVVG